MANKLDDPAYDDPKGKVVKQIVSTETHLRETLRYRLQGDHVRIRFLATLAALLHMAIAAGIMFMGYSPNQSASEKYSTSILMGAFGSLITVIWSVVASWEAGNEFSKPELPDWNWHNTQFMTAVTVMFGMSLVLWPSLLVFMLHSLRKNFFVLVTEFPSSLVGVLWFHVAAFLALLLLNIALLVISTKALRGFQANEDQDQSNPVPPPAPTVVKWLTIARAIGDIVGCTDLLIIIANTDGNSGVIFCLLVQIVCLGMGVYLTYKIYRDKATGATWFIAWRASGVIHIFVGWIVFWLSAGLLVLVAHLKVGFFAALVKGQTSVVYFEIVLFVLFIFVYIALLYSHVRCMYTLNRSSSSVGVVSIEMSAAMLGGRDLQGLSNHSVEEKKFD